MALNAPYTANTIIQSAQVSNDLIGLANGSNDTATNSMSTFRSEATYDFVASGCVWSGDSYGATRNASMTAGVVYIGGVRLPVALVTARLFTASKDTYIDSNNSGVLVYTEVTNNAASPSLAANSLRIGIIITGASNIANVGSVNQGQHDKVLPVASSVNYSVQDSLGNLICSRDSQRRVLGYRQLLADFTTATTGSLVDVTGTTCPVIIPANRRIVVKVGEIISNTGGAGVYMTAGAWRAATTPVAQQSPTNLGASDYTSINPLGYDEQTGSQSYSVFVGANATITTFRADAAGYGNRGPGFIMIELA